MERKIGVVCPSDMELEPFLPCLKNTRITEKAMLRFYQGTIETVPVVLLYSGVCKVNAAIAAQILIDAFQVTAVINAGVAGGMAKEVGLLDLVVSEQTAYHDVAPDILTEFHPWLPNIYFEGDPLLLAAARRAGEKMDRPVHFGKMMTGEQFIVDENREAINQAFHPLSVDMETASFAHVCHVNQVPFLAVRAISDTEEHSGHDNFEKNCQAASEIAKTMVVQLLRELAKAQ